MSYNGIFACSSLKAVKICDEILGNGLDQRCFTKLTNKKNKQNPKSLNITKEETKQTENGLNPENLS